MANLGENAMNGQRQFTVEALLKLGNEIKLNKEKGRIALQKRETKQNKLSKKLH